VASIHLDFDIGLPTSFVIIGLAIAVVEGLGVLAGWFWFVRRMKTKAPEGSAPGGWGLTEDDRKWEKDAAVVAHTELADIREAAKNWATSIGAILGIGGTVAFVKGEDAFAKLTTQEGNYAFWLTVTAALLAGLAIGFATFAAQGTPFRYKSIDGWTLRKVSRSGSLLALRRLLWSKVLAIVAAVAILAVAGISWKSSIAEDTPENAEPIQAIVTTIDGKRRCGELSTTGRGNLWVQTGKERMAVDGTNEIVTVETCPAKK
jgi:hypothetical protein